MKHLANGPVKVGHQAEDSLDVLGDVPGPHIVRPKQSKGCQEVEDEDGGPADEEHEHDQDQHVDYL